jgi:hypothetical protein
LRESIADIETSIEVHKDILRDIISSKSVAYSLDGSSETDVRLLVPGKPFEKLLGENKHLETCIEWASRELEAVKDSILRAEMEMNEARMIEESRSQKLLGSIKDFKSRLRKQERKLQSLETRAASIENECELASKQDAQMDTDGVLAQMKKVISQLMRRGRVSFKSCAELEVQEASLVDHLQQLRGLLKLETKFELPCTEGHKESELLELNYEEYFYSKNKYQFDEVSDSLSSKEFDSSGLKLPNKVNVHSKQKPRLPRLNLAKLSFSNEESKLDSKFMYKSQAALLELEYLNRLKADEIESSQKLLEYLQAQHAFLSASLAGQPVRPK